MYSNKKQNKTKFGNGTNKLNCIEKQRTVHIQFIKIHLFKNEHLHSMNLCAHTVIKQNSYISSVKL